MAGLNKRYDVEIKVLSPLSIGAGAENDWTKGSDFVRKDKKIYKLSLAKMISRNVDVEQLSQYFATRDSDGIVQILGNQLEAVSEAVFSAPIDTENDIKSFVRNELSGKPIIAGSSLKGAVRSILFEHLRTAERNEREVFGNSKDGSEFMRFVKFTDAEFDKTELVNTKIFNLHQSEGNWIGGWKHSGSSNGSTNSTFKPTGFNTIYEAIMPGQTGFGNIMLSEKAFDLFRGAQVKTAEKKGVLDIKTLFQVINNHTKKYLEKERAFFTTYPATQSSEIVDFIDAILRKIPTDDNSCILKMSAGSGFHSITGDWQFPDYTSTGFWAAGKNAGKKKYKSRKIAVGDESFSLIGFVSLCILSEKEKERRLKEIEDKRAKEENLRMEEERAREARNQKMADYEMKITAAQVCYDKSSYQEACKILQEAEKLFPEGNKHQDLLKDTNEQINKERAEFEAEELRKLREKEQEERRQQQITGGLSFLEEKYDTGQYKVSDFKGAKNRINAWLKKSGNNALPENQIEALTHTLSRLFLSITKEKEQQSWVNKNDGIWKDVVQWVGEEKGDLIFNEIINKK